MTCEYVYMKGSLTEDKAADLLVASGYDKDLAGALVNHLRKSSGKTIVDLGKIKITIMDSGFTVRRLDLRKPSALSRLMEAK